MAGRLKNKGYSPISQLNNMEYGRGAYYKNIMEDKRVLGLMK
jgi:glutamine cyclotransferase